MTGAHAYTVYKNKPLEELDAQIQAKLNGEELDQNDFRNWPPEKVRKFEEQQLAELQNNNEGLRAKQDVDAFLAAHPEYKDCPSNSKLMNAALRLIGVSINPTFEQLEAAYDSFRSNDLLVLDKKVVAEQQKEAAKQRAADHKAKKFNEEEAYSISMDELHRRAMGF